jgi:MscS family membrane protein
LSEQTHNPDTRCRKRAHTAASEPGTRFSCVGAFRGRFFFALLLVLVTPAAGALAPLAGPDTSSLRATFESFLALSEEAARRLSDQRDAPSHATATRIFQIANSAESLFDLREVPVAAQREVAAETFYLLWDVVSRVPSPDLAAIPGEDAVGNEPVEKPARWCLPGTEITITRVEEGPQNGEYLFSADTVKRARQFYELAQALPYQRQMPSGDVYRTTQMFTGWMIPLAWVEALPDWANTAVLGQLLWKWLVLLLLFGVTVVMLLAVFRWSRRRPWDGTLRSYLRHLVTPLATLALATLMWYLATFQINVSGSAAEVPLYLARLASSLAVVWMIWLTAGRIAEAIIASPHIKSESLDAHLIRLAARIVGTLTILVLAFNLAEEMGIPVYGLVAGAPSVRWKPSGCAPPGYASSTARWSRFRMPTSPSGTSTI